MAPKKEPEATSDHLNWAASVSEARNASLNPSNDRQSPATSFFSNKENINLRDESKYKENVNMAQLARKGNPAKDLPREDRGTSLAENSEASLESLGAKTERVPTKLSGCHASENIFNELVCPICLDFFCMPVTMKCGHTFCRYCISHGRLIGGACPLCREALDGDYCINTVISNLLTRLNLGPTPGITTARALGNKSDMSSKWWSSALAKPVVPLPLFLRVFFGDTYTSPLLVDDAVSCIRHVFDSNSAWTHCEWMFGLEDAQKLMKLVGTSCSTIEEQREDLIIWISKNIKRFEESPAKRNKRHYIFEICVDRAHQVEGTCIDTRNIMSALPWDLGRHLKSQIQLPHTSVSSSHLLLVPMPNDSIGVVECGSTIGTMIKITDNYVLGGSTILHLGDRVEVELVLQDTPAAPPDDTICFVWDRTQHTSLLLKNGYIHGTKTEVKAEEIGNHDDPKKRFVHIKPTCCAKIKTSNGVYTSTPVDPRGTVMGRGPYTQHNMTKIGVTTTNGYVSRDHCMLYFGAPSSADPPHWRVKDMSMLGTYIKLSPFVAPYELKTGDVFKAGQCRIIIKEISDTDSKNFDQETVLALQSNASTVSQRLSHITLDNSFPHTLSAHFLSASLQDSNTRTHLPLPSTFQRHSRNN